MKISALIKLLASALLLISGAASAQILGSLHDMTTNATYNNSFNNGQTCVYCHTPHNASAVAGGPLWNRATAPTNSYTPYTSVTLDATDVDATLGAESLACMTCHDGTIAIDNLWNFPGSTYDRNVAADVTAWEANGNNPMSATALGLMGTDLSDDHPVGFTYNPGVGAGLDAELNTEAAATTAGVRFFASELECATCHDVHDATFDSFLRVTTTGSAICTACHAK